MRRAASPRHGSSAATTADSRHREACRRLRHRREFDRLLKAATEARQAERWEEAIALYEKAVKLKPDYVEGYWYQGTAYYTLDNFTRLPRDVPQGGDAGAEERRRLRVSRPVRVRR